MVNRLVHEVSVEERHTVENVQQLMEILRLTSEGCDDELEKTYVVELLREQFSDGSFKRVVSIREAEPI